MVRSLHLMLLAASSSAMLDEPLEQTSLLQVNRDVAGVKCSSGKCTPGEELPEPEPLSPKGSCSEKKCKDGFKKRKNAGTKDCKDVKCTHKECCRKLPIIVLPKTPPTVRPTTRPTTRDTTECPPYFLQFSCRPNKHRVKKMYGNCPGWGCECNSPMPITCPPNKHSVTKMYEDCPALDCECNSAPMPTCMGGGSEQVVIDGCPLYRCTEVVTDTPTTTKKPDVELECDDPKCDLEELCKNTVTLSTNEQSLIRNNLGGRGPGTTEGNDIRYASLINGKNIDLVVTVRGDDKKNYKNMDQQAAIRQQSLSRNGARGDFGTISIADQEDHKFRFEFQNSKTREPVKLASVMFTFFDLDGRVPGGESISSCDAKYAVTAKDTTLSTNSKNGCKTFSSSVRHVLNVEDYTKMTVDQKKASVVMVFEDKSGFDLDFSIDLWTGIGRNFLFTAHPTFVCPGITGKAGKNNKGGRGRVLG